MTKLTTRWHTVRTERGTRDLREGVGEHGSQGQVGPGHPPQESYLTIRDPLRGPGIYLAHTDTFRTEQMRTLTVEY